MNTQLTVQERLNRYEIAQETLGFMMAIYNDLIYKEEDKREPDLMSIEKWNTLLGRLDSEMDTLRLHDDNGVQRVLEKYCPVVKSNFESRGIANLEA